MLLISINCVSVSYVGVSCVSVRARVHIYNPVTLRLVCYTLKKLILKQTLLYPVT